MVPLSLSRRPEEEEANEKESGWSGLKMPYSSIGRRESSLSQSRS